MRDTKSGGIMRDTESRGGGKIMRDTKSGGGGGVGKQLKFKC